MYPRPSPYIESNLHKFGTGPSSTMVPIQNQIPVSNKKINLTSNQYYQKTDQKLSTCYCCLNPIQQDFIDHLDKYLSIKYEEDTSSIE